MTSRANAPTYGAVFWIGLSVGWAVVVYGVVGALNSVWLRDRPAELALWVAGGLVAHDVLLAPLVTAVAFVLALVLPRWLRGPIAGALALSGLVALFSYPLLRAFGRRASNATLLPHDYGRNVLRVLLAIWTVALVVIAIRAARRATT